MNETIRQPRTEAPSRIDELRARLTGTARIAVVADRDEVRKAAQLAARESICRPILIGEGQGHDIDPERDVRRLEMLDLLLRLPGGRRLGMREAESLGSDPTWYALLMVASGRAEGALTGSIAATIEAARATLGPSLDGPGVALAWFLEFADRLLVYGMASEPEPSAEELAGAGSVVAEGLSHLLREPPRLAFLSFSTLGSMAHERAERVRRAKEILAEGEPEYLFDGELEADIALSPQIAEREGAPSLVAGQANILVFPDLDSGKIALELSERLAGARVAGPLLLGPSRPVTPCLGESAKEILDLITLVAFEAERGSP